MDIQVRRDVFQLAQVFTISRGSRTQAEVLTVRVSDGAHAGLGECVPYARYGESLESVSAEIMGLPADATRDGLQELLPAGAARNVSKFNIQTKKRFRRYKIYIDSPSFPGWNEIDAIGVHTKRGTKWASRVSSSSSYGDSRVVSPFRFTGNGIF